MVFALIIIIKIILLDFFAYIINKIQFIKIGQNIIMSHKNIHICTFLLLKYNIYKNIKKSFRFILLEL
jgi:hypothetical protein